MDQQPHAALTRIGDCVLDRAHGTLVRGAEIIPVRAKTYALLTHLADNRGRVISKDELLTTVWPAVIVSEDSLTQCVRDLRKALGDEEQRWIRTVSRRGYLLADDKPSAVIMQVAPSGAIGEGEPAVAVLPFAVIGGGDPVLIDGIIEEITNGLARFKSVTVVARASAFSFPAGNGTPPQTIGEKLGADHLVEGTFRRTPAGYRVSVTLTHAPTARQIWSEQFDCSETDLLDIDAVIARQIISRLVANIEDSVLRRSATKPAADLRAFEYLTRGIVYIRGYAAEANEKGRDCFRRAIDIDPNYGLAYAYLALAELIIGNYSLAPRSVLEASRDLALQALTLAPEEARCHRIMALVRLYLREHAAAEKHLRRSLNLNPYDADTLAQMGYLRTKRGYADEGLAWLDRAVELNPLHPPWYHFDRSMTLYVLGRYPETIEAIDSLPSHHRYSEALRAAAHAMQGNDKAAAHHMKIAIDMKPDVPIETDIIGVEFEHESDYAHVLEGVRLALAALQSSS